MNAESLNHAQRAILQAAEVKRLKLAKMARIQAAVKAAQAPDYFQHAEYAARFMADVRRICRHWTRDGANPYHDMRGMLA